MSDLHFVLPGRRSRRTGGFIYDDRIVRGLQGLGNDVAVHELPDGFPDPTAGVLETTERVFRGIPSGRKVVIDGLALGVLPDLMRAQSQRLELVALVHHPLALETGLRHDRRETLFESERAALTAVGRIITTSRATARILDRYGVEAERVRVVVPGVDPAPLADGSKAGPFQFFCAAALTKRKGHEILLKALAALRDKDWRLTCAGSCQEDPETALRLFNLGKSLGLEGRVSFLGQIGGTDMAEQYRGADAFVLASHYEGYGMVLSEALSHGLPIVSTTGGAIPEAVQPGGALLVPPGDEIALAEALGRLLDEPDLRQDLADAAKSARPTLPTWSRSAAKFASAVGLAERP